MNQAERLTAELRAAVHADVDRIFDAWPVIFENRRSLEPAGDRGDRTRKSAGSHSDPTGDTATSVTAAMKWLDEVKDVGRRLQSLMARSESLIGRPACAGCGEDIGIRPMRRFRSRPYHADGCHQRAHRERTSAA